MGENGSKTMKNMEFFKNYDDLAVDIHYDDDDADNTFDLDQPINCKVITAHSPGTLIAAYINFIADIDFGADDDEV